NISVPFTTSMPVDSEAGNQSCRFDEEFKYILLPVSYSLVCVLGLFLNSVALWMFLTKMRPWNTSTVYMFHLSLSDTLYVLSLPTLIYYYANRSHWPFGMVLCKVVRFLFYANLYCSILFLTCISVHRYLGICHPIRSLALVKPRHAHLVCGLVWAAVGVCLVPNLVFVTITQRDNDTLCHDTSSPDDFERYVAYSSVVMRGAARRKSIKLIVIVLVVFAVSFVPFHITRTLYYTYRVLGAECWYLNIINFAYKVTRPLASSNSCLDPILYFLAGDHYRSRLLHALTRRPIASQSADNKQPTPAKKNDIALVCKQPDDQDRNEAPSASHLRLSPIVPHSLGVG
ncbi:hypothetical protein P4O66_020086, partial [Electrophorus voltai]